MSAAAAAAAAACVHSARFFHNMNGGQGRPLLPNSKLAQAEVKADVASGKQKQLTTFFPPAITDSAVRAACLSLEGFFQGRQQFAHVLKAIKLAVPQKGKTYSYEQLYSRVRHKRYIV